MKNKPIRIITAICATLLLATLLFTLAGCIDYRLPENQKDPNFVYDKYGNTYPAPTDNDQEGWFSVEVLNQYAVPAFVQPKGSEVADKPQRDALYLTGNETTFKEVAKQAFKAITLKDTDVYIPTFEASEDGTVSATKLTLISSFDFDTLAPNGEATSVVFVYESGGRINQCNISLETTADNVEQTYIAFAEKTEEYKSLL